MNILITGGTGFIGSALTDSLLAQGHQLTVLSRDPDKVSRRWGASVLPLASIDDIQPESRYEVVINLAGAPIFDSRWTEARKQLLRDSRIQLTERLVEAMARMRVKPELLISGSAVGYYGDQGDTVLTEQSGAKPDFSHQLCKDWEQAALQAENLGIRVCLIRTGLVIAGDGGLLKKMLLPFRFGLGGRMGSGRQWMSWIHREDWLRIAHKLISDPMQRGIYNATAPNPVTNSEFTKTLAYRLNRPALLPVPAVALKTLLGEMSELVLGSQRVLPDHITAQGFTFSYPTLDDALLEALGQNPNAADT